MSEHENTYERQAGVRQRREAVGGGADGDGEGSEASSWSDASEEEDLFPDVDVPDLDDVVCIRSQYVKTYAPIWSVETPPDERKDPAFVNGFRVGRVLHVEDFAENEIPPDHIPVHFTTVDDRYSGASLTSTEFVHRDQIEIIDRPFTVSERVVCAGKTGQIDEVELDLGIKRLTFPPHVKPLLPMSLADQLHFAKSDAPLPTHLTSSTAHQLKRFGASVKHMFKKRTAHKAGFHATEAVPPYRVSREELEAELTYVPASGVLPLHPFRPEACVIDKKTLLVGMVTGVAEIFVITFADGSIAAVSNAINDFDQLVHPQAERPPALVTRPVRIAKADREALAFLVGAWSHGEGDEEDEPEYRDGVITAVLPFAVTCVYTSNNGETWDVGPATSHPRDLCVLDLYYGEFASIMQPCYRLDDVLRQRVRDVIRRRCEAASVDCTPILENLEERDIDFTERRRRVEERPHECVDQVGQWEVAVDAANSSAVPTEAILKHAMRCSARDVPSVCGSFTPLEYNVFYEELYPPYSEPDSPDGGSRDEWLEVLQRHAILLPHLAQVRLTRTLVNVVWSNGEVEYRRDARQMKLRTAATADDEYMPLHLVGPSEIRRATFPINMGVIDEKVGEFDVTLLPMEHYTTGAGDIVLYKCKDDFDRESQQPGGRQDVPRVVGRIVAKDTAERVMTVRWTPIDQAGRPDLANRDSFPTHSEPDLTNPLTKAVAAVIPVMGQIRIGGVTRILSDGTVCVSWWDLQDELVYQPQLSVVQFVTIEEYEAEAQDEEEAEEEHQEDDSTGATAPPTTDAVAAKAGFLTNVVQTISGLFRGNKKGDNATTASPASPDAPEPDFPAEAAVAAPAIGRFIVVEGEFASNTAAPAEEFVPAEPTRFYKRIQAEWKMLQRDVPAGVVVKVSETQMHWMKILVQGPVHTPYYQGVYLFDVFFPPAFPAVPPVVKFLAYGIRMNPNLYDNGYVCLSLLGTWQGKSAAEEWNPVTSNMVQLILALQAMILCKEPYYNEPGFEDTMGTERGLSASRLANEQYYLYKVEHLFKLASNPPPDWKAEVTEHAREYFPKLLARARTYLEPEAAASTPAPAPRETRLMNSDGLVLPLSKGFRISLQRAVELLDRQFAKLTAATDSSNSKPSEPSDAAS